FLHKSEYPPDGNRICGKAFWIWKVQPFFSEQREYYAVLLQKGLLRFFVYLQKWRFFFFDSINGNPILKYME
ncbi:MAG: hypothetical protein J6I42_01410, partial [Clostridia bacterium]|nr:hypothetical protein [Clostridia bacterium]